MGRKPKNKKTKNRIFGKKSTVNTIIVKAKNGGSALMNGGKNVGNVVRDASVGTVGTGLIVVGKTAIAAGQQLVKAGSGLIDKTASQGNVALRNYAQSQRESVAGLTIVGTIASALPHQK